MKTGGTNEGPPGEGMLSDSEWAKLGRQMMLSDREVQVLRCVFAEQKDEVIAHTLGIAPSTVRTHLERLYRKCGCHTRTGAVASAFKAYVRVREDSPPRR